MQGVEMILGFVSLPLTLKYLNVTLFGIIITLNSIIDWFTYFDLGIGEGMRNKLCEALACNNLTESKTIVSTAYFILFIIFSALLLILLFVNKFINWNSILNTNALSNNDLLIITSIIIITFCVKNILSPINKVFQAKQEPAFMNLLGLISRIFYIILIIILIKYTTASAINYTILQNSLIIIIPLIASLYFYRKKLSGIAPSFHYIDIKKIKNLLNLGLKFFVISISLVVTMLTNNFLISHYLGPEQVTLYNVTYKYFSFPFTLFLFLIAPTWSAFTNAYFQSDLHWITNKISYVIKIWGILITIMIIMLIFNEIIFKFWVGSKIKVSYSLSIIIIIYFITYSWIGIYNSFINSVSKIKLQIILTVFGAIINIPVSIIFVKYLNFGSAGIILGSVISLLPCVITAPVQTYKILYKRAYGIWGK